LIPTLNGHRYPDYFEQKGHFPDYMVMSGNRQW
jgi:hypothetical protein